MKLPKTTIKQREIIELLYQYRFLNRIQIQAFMGHKDKKTINAWLRDLKAKQYIDWIYDPDHFARKTIPAIYYIAINGVRYLKTIHATDGSTWYPLEDVRKRYREHERSHSFIEHCMQVADCCVTMNAHSIGAKTYSYVTRADYTHPYSAYHFLSDSELVQPDLCFVKQEWTQKKVAEIGDNESDQVTVTTTYILEIFDASLPRYRIKKRLSNYIEFIDDGTWERETDADEPPIILLACPRTADLIYAKRRTRGLIANIWEHDDQDRPHIRFATLEKLKLQGVTGKIWEEA